MQGMDGKFAPLPKRLKKSDLKDVEFIQNESSEMASSSRAEYRCKDKGANIHVLEQLVEKEIVPTSLLIWPLQRHMTNTSSWPRPC